MEQYPSIDKIIRNIPMFAYDKLDGSNIRVEWSRKTGFYKFGSRTQLIDDTHPLLGESISLFNEKYSDDLNSIFAQQRWVKATAFLEFYGDNSFAGFHEDEPHTVTLFDVHVYKKGMLEPKEFNKVFSTVETAPILYEGKANSNFVDSVKNGTLEGMTFEGVVCKAGRDNRNRITNFKIKNQAWLDKLKTKCGSDEKMFNQLA